MMVRLIILAIVYLASFAHSKAVDPPLFEKLCPLGTENYVECATSSFEKSWPRIVEGVPELNIPPLDPLIIEEINDKIDFGPIQGKYHFSNLAVHGISGAKLLSVNPKIEDNHLHLELEIYQSKGHGEADYDVEGNFYDLVVSAKGHGNSSMSDITIEVALDGPIVDDRWTVEMIKITPKIGDMKLWASDLFNGNKAFTEALLMFINQNWKDLHDVALAMMQPFANKYLKNFINELLAEVPVSQVFPQ